MSEPTSDRGFLGYTKFNDQHRKRTGSEYGCEVWVHESSAASGPHVWVTLDGKAHLTGPNERLQGLPYGMAPGKLSAHLGIREAQKLRDALDEWLHDVPERWENGAAMIHAAEQED